MSDICRMDEDDCLSLVSIYRAFHCGIKEEHSWALIYQSIVALKEYIKQYNESNCFKEPNHLFIKSNGAVHPKSWHTSTQNETSVTLTQVVSFIAKAVYEALDYGTDADEEMIIPPVLEQVFDEMSQDSCDEGIGEIDDISTESLLDSVLNKCETRVIDGMVGDHYRNVCRALVAEAIEVSTFLNQISKGTKELTKIKNVDKEEVDAIHVEVWAHLWMKVMRQLRVGVSLKSVDNKEFINRQQKEYELTPFEMLLDDINSKRYSLKKVSLPKKVEKDARTKILDFIRSRPPLKPATERVLSPPPKPEPCLHDQLMEGIKSTRNLKPTKTFERKFDSYHLPRGKRFSIYSRNVAIDTPAQGLTNNVFQRFSFRNLSLRSTALNHNTKSKAQVDSSPVTTTPTSSKVPFWRKFFW